ncbi:transposable element Tcb2 transposase [Trichonephila clavipes]|nr:transposable element Tcb2 transposase [Trichonephila clavipes]
MTLFVLSHRKIVQCVQCKVKKYTFDMIERISDSNQVQMYCSLNCLSLFRVNVNATSSKCILCDNCSKNIPAQYHLTMSDGSVRNFCTYQCVLCFQNQFPTASHFSTSSNVRQPVPKPAPKLPTPPIITNVASLAQSKPAATVQGKNLGPQTLGGVRQQGPSIAALSSKTQVSTIPSTSLTVSAPPPGTPTVIREIVVRPPTPKSVKNKSAAVKPIMLTKGINVKLVTCHKAVQTDERPMPIILPVPIPVYVPTPMHMFSRPVPCPVPFPVPIPVPVIIQSNKGHKEESIPNHDTDSVRTTESTEDSIEKQKVEKLAYQLNEEAERTERPIRRLSKVMYGSTYADMQVDVMGECLSSIKHVVGARRNRRQTAGEIARHTTQATGRPISRFTVARRLHGGGLFARCPVRCVPLTPAHRRRRSLWCREHRNWRDNEWGRVLFTDESRFSLSSDSHRILIWRERGSRNHPSNIIERDRYGGRGVLVWGDIILGSRTNLHIFDAGSVNGTRYCNEILLPYVRLFRGTMVLQFLLMDDNAPCHRTVAAEQLLESEDIERMDWPARSPDLNPIEHVWDFLGRRLAVTIRELRLALQDEWAAMPQQLIDTLILSLGKRFETCLAVRGDHIPY